MNTYLKCRTVLQQLLQPLPARNPAGQQQLHGTHERLVGPQRLVLSRPEQATAGSKAPNHTHVCDPIPRQGITQARAMRYSDCLAISQADETAPTTAARVAVHML
jgi:hypothetical protein